MIKLKYILPICVVLFMFGGCSSVARVKEMVGSQERIKLVNHFTGSVTVVVSGGDERIVSNNVFSDALIKTINDAKLFASASPSKGGRYELSVVILSATHNGWGNVARMTCLWTLRTSDGKELWSETFDASGNTAVMAAGNRIRVASERTARADIEDGLSRLSALDIR